MVAINDVTGDAIQSKAASKAYSANYDNIFGKKKQLPEGRVEVKSLKRGQIVYDRDIDDYYKVYSAPHVVNGEWEVETTSSGDYVVIFKEGKELWISEAARDKELLTTTCLP